MDNSMAGPQGAQGRMAFGGAPRGSPIDMPHGLQGDWSHIPVIAPAEGVWHVQGMLPTARQAPPAGQYLQPDSHGSPGPEAYMSRPPFAPPSHMPPDFSTPPMAQRRGTRNPWTAAGAAAWGMPECFDADSSQPMINQSRFEGAPHNSRRAAPSDGGPYLPPGAEAQGCEGRFPAAEAPGGYAGYTEKGRKGSPGGHGKGFGRPTDPAMSHYQMPFAEHHQDPHAQQVPSGGCWQQPGQNDLFSASGPCCGPCKGGGFGTYKGGSSHSAQWHDKGRQSVGGKSRQSAQQAYHHAGTDDWQSGPQSQWYGWHGHGGDAGGSSSSKGRRGRKGGADGMHCSEAGWKGQWTGEKGQWTGEKGQWTGEKGQWTGEQRRSKKKQGKGNEKGKGGDKQWNSGRLVSDGITEEEWVASRLRGMEGNKGQPSRSLFDGTYPSGEPYAGASRERKQTRGGLSNTLQKAGAPSHSFAQTLRAAKAKLRHVEIPSEPSHSSSSQPPRAARRSSRGAPEDAGPSRALRVSWVLPDESHLPKVEPQDEDDETVWDPSELRAVRLRLENAIKDCKVTVSLNGEQNVLAPGSFGRRRGQVASKEKRFEIAPLHSSAGINPGACEADPEKARSSKASDAGVARDAKPGDSCEGREEREPQEEPAAEEEPTGTAPTSAAAAAPAATTEPHSEDEDEEDEEEEVLAAAEASRAPEADVPRPCEAGAALEAESVPAGPAAFAAVVTLESVEVQGKTTQELLEPDVEIVDIFDTAVVLRLSLLTGDRFELTVYASASRNQGGAPATLVHRAPIKSPESVHRIGQLEPAQVYVAWVRVFCESSTRESKQKGFKTLPARVKTMWDEPDHVVLGVARDATMKEITKAFRQKSLLCHPDKETDPEKKDEAEEMMKRLNLAKQNMMKGVRPDEEGGDSMPPTPSNAAGHSDPFRGASGPMHQPRHFFSDSEYGSNFGSADSSDDECFFRKANSPHMGASPGSRKDPKSPLSADFLDGNNSDQGSLCCSLRIEAAKPPKLKVVERGLRTLSVEATALPVGGKVEVQKFVDDMWIAAVPAARVTAESMQFLLENLEENQSYRLRLITIVELEPLRLLFAEFAQREAPKAIVHTEAKLDDGGGVEDGMVLESDQEELMEEGRQVGFDEEEEEEEEAEAQEQEEDEEEQQEPEQEGNDDYGDEEGGLAEGVSYSL